MEELTWEEWKAELFYLAKNQYSRLGIEDLISDCGEYVFMDDFKDKMSPETLMRILSKNWD